MSVDQACLQECQALGQNVIFYLLVHILYLFLGMVTTNVIFLGRPKTDINFHQGLQVEVPRKSAPSGKKIMFGKILEA